MSNTTEVTATVTRNLEHNGLEITFSGVPSAKIRTSLKSNGFHWHNGKQIWYAKYNDKHTEFIRKMKWELPESEEEPEDEPEEEVTEVEEPEERMIPNSEFVYLQKRILELEAELAKYKKPVKVVKSEKTDIAIINRITKAAKNNALFGKANKFSGGYAFTEGHYLVADSDTHGLEVSEELKAEEMIKGIKNTDKHIPIDLDDLKAFKKLHNKKTDLAPYIVNDGKNRIGLNPQFLLDCLTWCGMSEIMINTDLYDGCYKGIVYVKGESRMALCLPVHLK